MKIRKNKIMERTLGQRGHDFVKLSVTLPTKLEQLIISGFRDEQECVLLKDFQYFGPGLLDSDYKRTQYEDFLNDVHIDDYTLDMADEFEYLKAGLEFSKRLYNTLIDSNRTSFRIVISFTETTYVGQEIDTYGGCVVNFHMVRPSCDDKFRVNDLNKFQLEGIMVIE